MSKCFPIQLVINLLYFVIIRLDMVNLNHIRRSFLSFVI